VFRAPLIGSTGRGRLARSLLRRTLSQPGVVVVPVAASLACGEGFMPGLLPRRLELDPYTGATPWGALAFDALQAWVSYPSRV
jgi:hypothetical protein